MAQFELICCDVVSVFITDAVMTQADAAYLAQLYGELLESDEFASVQVSLQVPDDAAGRSLVDQFVHRPFSVYTQQMTMTRKKARIMTHWAIRCGGNVARLS